MAYTGLVLLMVVWDHEAGSNTPACPFPVWRVDRMAEVDGSIVIPNWEHGCFDDLILYLATAASFMKMIELQTIGRAEPLPFNGHITIQSVHAGLTLAYTAASVVNQALRPERRLGLEIGYFPSREDRAPPLTMDATSLEYLQWRSIIISYHERTKALARRLFPNWTPERSFLEALRHAFAHDGYPRPVPGSRPAAEWRGLRFDAIPPGSRVYPVALGPADLILLLYDVDKQLLEAHAREATRTVKPAQPSVDY